MIPIVRTPEPPFLQSEKVIAAKDKLHKRFENTAQQERFRFDVSLLGEVKDDLLHMCNSKCAYCETKLNTASYGDVDNFRPKAGARGMGEEYAPYHYWWLAYTWDNLLISCQICNAKYKRDYFPLESEMLRAPIGAMGTELLDEKALLIDPCKEDPSEHLNFLEDGHVVEKTKRGKFVIEILGLNRVELVEQRKEAAEVFKMRLARLMNSASEQKQSDVEYIHVLLSDAPPQQYAATLRAVFAEWIKNNQSLWAQITAKDSSYNEQKKASFQTRNERSYSSALSDVEKEEVTEKLSTIKRFSIKSIEIENFKSIEKLTLQILPVRTSEIRESWLLLLGDNGIGKSSILQAIALALAGKRQLDRLALDVMDFLKRGTKDGHVTITSYEQDKPVVLHFDESGFRSDLEEPPTFLLGYGSTRLLPKGPIQPETGKQPYVNIANLFDYSIALNDPHTWLNAIDTVEFNDRVASVFFDVLALRNDDRLYMENGKINIQQFGASYELEDNSDGYKTIVALVTDIMQTLSVDKAGYHNSQGMVLIDEIGNHLHPRWRLKIVSALRRAFPHLQFIVTTHEPLCLRGLAHGEVVVLVRDQEKKIRALDKELLPDHSMMRIEQLLTSDLFGLINVMDEKTEKTYEEYYQLLSKKEEEKTDQDKMKIQEISSQLATKEVLGATPEEQVMYQVINETFAKKIREEGFKTKEELKQETVAEVKAIIKTKNFNWL